MKASGFWNLYFWGLYASVGRMAVLSPMTGLNATCRSPLWGPIALGSNLEKQKPDCRTSLGFLADLGFPHLSYWAAWYEWNIQEGALETKAREKKGNWMKKRSAWRKKWTNEWLLLLVILHLFKDCYTQ